MEKGEGWPAEEKGGQDRGGGGEGGGGKGVDDDDLIRGN